MNGVLARVGAVPGVWQRPLLGWLAAVALVLLVYRQAAWSMVLIWERSETYAHAFVVPPIALWLAWRLRGQLAGVQPSTAPLVALALVVMALGLEVGALVQVAALQHFMLVGLLVATVPLMLGPAVARALMFPLGFLFFAVPFGEFLTPWLVNYTADFTVAAIRLTGIPVFREGNQFVIPSGRWSVVEACSGIRYLMASLMVGTLFAYLNYRSLHKRWAFVGVSIVTPIIANWLRAYMIVMIGHLSNNRLAAGVDHLIYGWVFFGVVIGLMFLIGARWADSESPGNAAPGAIAAVTAIPAGRHLRALTALCLSVAGIHAGAAVWLVQNDSVAAPAAQQAWPQWAAGWSGQASSLSVPRPAFEGASSDVQQTIIGPAVAIGLRVIRFDVQDSERKLISSVNGPLHTESTLAWHVVSTQIRQDGLPTGLPGVREHRLARSVDGMGGSSGKWLVWQFYWIDGQPVYGDIQGKLRQAWQQLRGQGSAGAVVLLYAEDLGDGRTQQQLSAFLGANFTNLANWLNAAQR